MKYSKLINEFEQYLILRRTNATRSSYVQHNRMFCLFMRDPEVEHLTDTQVSDYLNLMLALGWDRNGLRPRAMALRVFFQWCRLKGYQVFNYELIPIPYREFRMPKIGKDEDYKKILAVIPYQTTNAKHVRDRALIDFLWHTGVRVGEALSLKLSDLEFRPEGGEAVIRTEKSRGQKPFRRIFFNKDTAKTLKRWIALRATLEDARHVFVNPESVFIGVDHWQRGKQLSTHSVDAMLREYSIKAGIPSFNPHQARHHFAREIIHHGGTNADIANMQGYADLSSTHIYTVMDGEELRNRRKTLGLGN